jgi:hypothetical protein
LSLSYAVIDYLHLLHRCLAIHKPPTVDWRFERRFSAGLLIDIEYHSRFRVSTSSQDDLSATTIKIPTNKQTLCMVAKIASEFVSLWARRPNSTEALTSFGDHVEAGPRTAKLTDAHTMPPPASIANPILRGEKHTWEYLHRSRICIFPSQ